MSSVDKSFREINIIPLVNMTWLSQEADIWKELYAPLIALWKKHTPHTVSDDFSLDFYDPRPIVYIWDS